MPTLISETAMKKRFNRLGWALVIMVFSVDLCFTIRDSILTALWQIGSETLTLTVGTIFETLLYICGFVLVAVLYFPMTKRLGSEPIAFSPKFPRYLPLVVLAGMSVCLSTAIVNDWFCNLIGYTLPYDESIMYMSDPKIFALYMTLSLAPAFAEELLFRGVVYSNLRPFGRGWAVIVSSLLFALMHQNVEQLFYAFSVGIVLALIYEFSGSIWGSIILHMFNNLYATLQTAVIYRFDEATASVILTLSHAILLFGGAVSILLLLQFSKRQESEKKKLQDCPAKGYFGKHSPESFTAYHMPATDRMWLKCMWTAPGMVTYLAITFCTTLLAISMYS